MSVVGFQLTIAASDDAVLCGVAHVPAGRHAA